MKVLVRILSSARAKKVKTYALIHACYLLYSLALVSAKFAGAYSILSFQAIVLYGVGFLLLGVFALAWQQILKIVPLTVASANRAVTIVFGMFWGVVLFGESISFNMVVGAALIMCGVVIMAVQHE